MYFRILAAGLLTSVLSDCGASERPDVLLIMVDDLRPMLGCYGDARIRTPNIDRLAGQSIIFEHAYCQYAKCGTSRLSLLTGLRPNAIGVYSNNRRDVVRFRKRNPNIMSLPRWLKRHGYHAQSFGKIDHDGWDVAEDWSLPTTPGREREMWEVVDTDNPESPTTIAERLDCPVIQSPDVADNHLFAGRMTDQVVRVIAEDRKSRPRFLAVGYRRPHLPFVAPRRYFDLYRPDRSWLTKSPLPPSKSPVMAWFNSDGYVGSAKRIGLSMPVDPDQVQAIEWNGYELRSYVGVPNSGPISEAVQLNLLQAYAACISYVDRQIGRLLDQVAQSAQADNTIIILCSDHGWHLGEHSAWGKMTNFEIGTRVPLLVSVPGMPTGRTKTIAELVDLYPTICELTKTPLPEHLQGESLQNVLLSPTETDDTSHAVSQYSRFQGKYMGTAVRTQQYRLVHWVETKTGRIIHKELYDHGSDRSETRNIVAEFRNPERLRKLEALLPQ